MIDKNVVPVKWGGDGENWGIHFLVGEPDRHYEDPEVMGYKSVLL